VCSRKRKIFLVFSLTADATFVHFNVLVCWKLQVRSCYCVECTRFSPFLIFFAFHKVVWLHSWGVVGKITNILLQIARWIQRWKKFKNRPTFGKVINEKCRWSLLTHSVHKYKYNVSQKKMCHFISVYHFRISSSIFIIFVPLETGMNTLQSLKINYLIDWWRHSCECDNLNVTKVYIIELHVKLNMLSL